MHNGPAFGRSSFTCPPRVMGASVLTGHRGFGYCRDIEFSPRGTFYFTSLRDPVSRVVSLHDYNLLSLSTGGNNKPLWEGSFKRETSLNDMVKRFNRTEEVESGEALLRYAASQQTRFLCGYECMGPHAKGNETYTDAFMLKRALANLNKIDAIGITERLNELIPILRLHLEFVPPTFHKWPEANSMSGRRKSRLDAEAHAILDRWAWADRELYRVADAMAAKQHAHATACLAEIAKSERGRNDSPRGGKGRP